VPESKGVNCVLQESRRVIRKASSSLAVPPPPDEVGVPVDAAARQQLDQLAVDFLAVGVCVLGPQSVRIAQVRHEGEVHDAPATLQSHCASLLAVWGTVRAPTVIDLSECTCIGKRLLALPSRHGRRFAVHAIALHDDEAVFGVISSQQPWPDAGQAKSLVRDLTESAHQAMHPKLSPRAAAPALPAQESLNWFTFSAREVQILKLLARGMSNKLIARELGSSPNTIRNQVHAVFRKTAVSNRTELALRAASLVQSARG
jgi:DNA-binding CsgD family transcriptional regulator